MGSSDLSHTLTTVGLPEPYLISRVYLLQIQPVFSGNYSEAAIKDLEDDVADEETIAEHYDYDSDSDLEDAEDLRPTEEPPPLRGHLFDPFCFTSDKGGGLGSNNDGAADDKPQDTTWYFRASLTPRVCSYEV